MGVWSSYGQHSTVISASLNNEQKTLAIRQELLYTNVSEDTLNALYLLDWANSFSSKKTPLAKRFSENFDRSFHLTNDRNRGSTTIFSITSRSGDQLPFERPKGHPDVIAVQLDHPLAPGASVNLQFQYQTKLPHLKFTRYGFSKGGEYNLRYWHLVPAVYNKGWKYYSNKNLDDQYTPLLDYQIDLSLPETYELITDLDQEQMNTSYRVGDHIVRLKGKQRKTPLIYLRQLSDFEEVQTDQLTVISNIEDDDIPGSSKAVITDRVIRFLTQELGEYPHQTLLLSEVDYRENPVYGLNQLPAFIRPFPDGFNYDIKLAKTAIDKFVDQTLLLNPRYDRWPLDALKIYLMLRYVETHYPNMKIVGNLSKYWLVRQFYLSEIEFNDQYNLLYTHMARLNLDQALTTPYDSLIKYNKNIGNAYKAGSGLNYLGEFIGKEVLNEAIRSYYESFRLQPSSSNDFRSVIAASTSVDTDWFFEDYVKTRKKIDYKIKRSRMVGDSVFVTIKNKRKGKMPIPLYAMKEDTVVAKTWITGGQKLDTFAFAKADVDAFILNKERTVPEFNLRDNYERPEAFLGINKPLQFKLFQDIENPAKNQVFFMPVAEYNLYDGLTLGLKMYNKTLLTKGFSYRIEPQYGLRSKSLIGNFSASYTHNIEEGPLYAVRYGLSANTFSYAPDLFYRRYSPYLTLGFRTQDFRSDKRQFLSIRNISVDRDNDPELINEMPDYNVLNVRYTNRNPGVIQGFNWDVDFQYANDFSKLSATAKYRKVYLNNRQLDMRLFAGTFLKNQTRENGDFFSFALDRPTDYLFEYNYYGRSEDSGLFSQQLIIAEGGFKSQLQPAFANQWLTSFNTSTTLWSFIYAYGDVGFVKNEGQDAAFVYDSGVRLSLLEDYFEIYLPVYSNLGWEIAQPEYDKKIRFIVTLSLDTLFNLFTRRWY
ncbi:metalloprotease [Croceiramulus getboli]|nr:metalloprotease [Flavobacteriaceae bacterium YJPT1-3]